MPTRQAGRSAHAYQLRIIEAVVRFPVHEAGRHVPPDGDAVCDGDVDARAIASNVARWLQAGVGGVVALGSNGEAPLLTEDESDQVIGAARERLPRERTLIAGTGRESTPATIAASRRAAVARRGLRPRAHALVLQGPHDARSLRASLHRGGGRVAGPGAPLQLSGGDGREPDARDARPPRAASEHRRRQGNRAATRRRSRRTSPPRRRRSP